MNTINTFLKSWKKRNEFEGALLAGSFATETQTEHSDIDIMIVLKNSTTWWERGNKIINGLTIEYLADPAFFWEESFENEDNSGLKIAINMFANGKVLVDPNGTVKSLQNIAKTLMKKPLKPMNKREIEMAKYHLYDGMKKLEGIKHDGFETYSILYFLQLNKLINYYASYLKIALPATAKLHRFIETLPDPVFVKNVKSCLINYSSLEAIRELTQYVLQKLGGFTIDGWVLKTELVTP